MKTHRLLLAFAIFLTINAPIFSQNTEGGQSEKIAIKTAAQTRTTLQDTLPQLPAEWLQRLGDSCTLVDYTYFTMPITMSLDQQPSIRTSLRHIGSGVMVRKAECKLFAKLFFQIKGQIVMDADLYFLDNSCAYFVYYIGGKPTFSNPLSTEGVQFFNQIVSRQKAKGK